MTDEAHFYLSGFVKNMRHWSPMNPQELQEKLLCSLKLMVWCGSAISGTVELYFFMDNKEEILSVHSDCYITVLEPSCHAITALEMTQKPSIFSSMGEQSTEHKMV